MGKKVISLSIDESDIEGILESRIILKSTNEIAYTDEYEVIDNENCLPDIGKLDYKNKELGLDLKDVTLRELYKKVLDKVLN